MLNLCGLNIININIFFSININFFYEIIIFLKTKELIEYVIYLIVKNNFMYIYMENNFFI